MALGKSILTVGGWTMGSRVLGLVRDILIAQFMGAGAVADAFFVAFKFPNFFRRLFAEGAFNAAFVPQFAGMLASDGPAAAKKFAQSVLAVLIAVLLPLTLLAQIAMPQIMVVLAPGFRHAPETFALAVDLTRLTFPYLLFMAIAALMSGVLNSLERFAAAAAAPIVLNIVLISALLGLTDQLPTAGHALAWGVAAAGAAQVVLLAIALARADMTLALPMPRLTPGVKRVLKLMVPGAIGAGVVQINLVVDTILASLLPAGSISYLYYADRVNQLPLGVVGVAIGVALLPMMARQLANGDQAGAMASQNRSVEIALLLTVPAAFALIAMPTPIVAMLFERGSFDAASTVATAHALQAFAIGLPAYVLIKALAPGFFARADTVTPVKIAAVAMIVNVIAAIVLMRFFAHVGIALATALSAWINAAALLFILRARKYFVFDTRLVTRVPRIVLAAALMGAALYFGAEIAAPAFAGPLVLRLAALAGLVVGGLALYGALVIGIGAASLEDMLALLRRRS